MIKSIEDYIEENGLFSVETEILHHTQDIILSRVNDPELLFDEYEKLSLQYSKLLRQTKKLVRMGDSTQRKLLETNKLVQEKVEKLTEAEKQLKKLSLTDPLTKLYNRRGIYEILDRLDRDYRENGKAFSLFIIDIDFFKTVNDRYGHNAGDLVLERLAKEMKGTLRKEDVLGRWGGEEFILILPGTDRIGALTLAEKVRKEVEDIEVSFEEEVIKVTISIGGCCFHSQLEINQCLVQADKALYRCKTGGRNRVEIHEH